MFGVNPPGTQAFYLTTFVGGNSGLGGTKDMIAINANEGTSQKASLQWLAPVSDLFVPNAGKATGAALPLVTLPLTGGSVPAQIFAGSNPGNSQVTPVIPAMGDVSIVK
jgi:hypothetical protein